MAFLISQADDRVEEGAIRLSTWLAYVAWFGIATMFVSWSAMCFALSHSAVGLMLASALPAWRVLYLSAPAPPDDLEATRRALPMVCLVSNLVGIVTHVVMHKGHRRA